ncbi:MAG: MaoC family dehydratase N-terminal domain-containing protein [Myxococcaceae bacterium]|nr:MaoC family dehydratase N-terminal domain-containing protein [Myxococcaceae bacterium]
MSIDPSNVGREYGPYTYTLGVEKMREFAYAVAGGVPSSSFGGKPPPGLNPIFWDEAAAKASKYGAIVAFPTFAVNFAMKPFTEAVTDPRLGIDLVKLVHGEQAFEFFDVMRPGDVMTTTGRLTEIYEKAGMDFVVMETESVNQHGRRVVKAVWTAVIRR